MDNVKIIPRRLKGRVVVPPSKSVAHRAIIAAGLSCKNCTLSNIELNDDIKATLMGMEKLGSSYSYDEKTKNLTIIPQNNDGNNIEIDCFESGSTLRFLLPIVLAMGKNVKFLGRGRLMQRPQKPYMDLFIKKGVKYTQGNDYIKVGGKLKSGKYEIAGDVSSQFITGLLFALPILSGDSEIIVTNQLKSKGYVDITLKVLQDFGIKIENKDYKKFIICGNQKYKPIDYTIEGDYSQGAFFLVAGALGCDIECIGLPENSLQGDKEIIDLIKKQAEK